MNVIRLTVSQLVTSPCMHVFGLTLSDCRSLRIETHRLNMRSDLVLVVTMLVLRSDERQQEER